MGTKQAAECSPAGPVLPSSSPQAVPSMEAVPPETVHIQLPAAMLLVLEDGFLLCQTLLSNPY